MIMFMLKTPDKKYIFSRGKQIFTPEKFEISPHKFHIFRVKSQPIEIFSQEGLVYVTQESDRKDYILASGERMIVRQTGVVLIEAFKNSLVRVSPAPAN
jgi:hypothetical protein